MKYTTEGVTAVPTTSTTDLLGQLPIWHQDRIIRLGSKALIREEESVARSNAKREILARHAEELAAVTAERLERLHDESAFKELVTLSKR